jgi:hypothetical protein
MLSGKLDAPSDQQEKQMQHGLTGFEKQAIRMAIRRVKQRIAARQRRSA